ncbi:MAG TPA: filamentous hemagglutinin N-terminal domain-containing protein, partial [Telmatospirillum sp.]|nr:filamentous hemagglutinin N-terminal domain-containing protein [Telmatospirillum sp.]
MITSRIHVAPRQADCRNGSTAYASLDKLTMRGHTVRSAKGTGLRQALCATTALISVATCLIWTASDAGAGPSGGTLAAGQAAISSTANTTTIRQSTDKAIINWTAFSLSAKESATFVQPSSSSISLNRVTGGDASSIYGALSANGQVWLVNPNGVLFGKGAQVNVGGLLATTSDIRDKDFIAGNYSFGIASPNANASVSNLGTIQTTPGGSVVLSAQTVSNEGVIEARLGTVVLGGAKTFAIDLVGDNLLNYQITTPVDQGSVTNSGSLLADGGKVLVTARAASAIADTLINTSGIIRADSVSVANGTVTLDSGDGAMVVGGTISAAGKTAGETGGVIKAVGGTTTVADGAVLDASGDAKGGSIETSGHYLTIGKVTVNTGSAHGKAGTWLLDPYDLTIDATGAAAIGTALSSGGNVLVQTTSSTASSAYGSANSSGNGDIIVASPVSWSAGGSLTLDAYRNIQINATISHSGSAGTLSLVYGDRTNTPGTVGASSSYGALAFGSGGNVTLQPTDTLSIAGQSYTVMTNWGSLVSAIDANPGGYYALGSSVSGIGSTAISSFGNSITGAGIFEGLGNTVSGFTLTGSLMPNVGLFDVTYGTIRDLNLASFSISSGYVGGTTSQWMGALAGQNNGLIANVNLLSGSTISGPVVGAVTNATGGLVGKNMGTILNSTVTGLSMTGGQHVGGLAGYNGGTITGSYATGTINASQGWDGGLVGENQGTITGSNASVAITGASNVGGLVGINGGRISTSFSTGTVTAPNGTSFDGGLVGYNGGTITDSFATGPVNAGANASSIGGLAGINASGYIANSYALGTINVGSAATSVGGLVGSNSGTVTSSYAAGSITTGIGPTDIGGLVGSNSGVVSSSYWDSATGQSVCWSGASIPICTSATVNMIDSVGTPSSAFSSGAFANFSPNTGGAWYMVDDHTRPMLTAFASSTITNAYQLELVGANLSGTYTLGNSIDLSAAALNAFGVWGTAGFASIGDNT